MNVSLGVVNVLILLVRERVDGSVGAGAQLGIRVLGHGLVGLLGGTSTGTLNALGDVVDGVLNLEFRILA